MLLCFVLYVYILYRMHPLDGSGRTTLGMTATLEFNSKQNTNKTFSQYVPANKLTPSISLI